MLISEFSELRIERSVPPSSSDLWFVHLASEETRHCPSVNHTNAEQLKSTKLWIMQEKFWQNFCSPVNGNKIKQIKYELKENILI